MKKFKIRCSAIGEIMARAKEGELPKGAKTYAERWVKEQIYGKGENTGNKYTWKGLMVEDDSIDFVAEQLDYGFLVKNEDFFENEYIQGTPDVIQPDHIIDVKNSWDAFTFPLFSKDIPDKGYYWQGQGYMDIVGRDHYKLIYTLMDTPEELLNPYRGEPQIYSNIDSKYRIKVFEFDKSQEDINKVYERVELIREYIKTLI